jgi:hypothetical protein
MSKETIFLNISTFPQITLAADVHLAGPLSLKTVNTEEA